MGVGILVPHPVDAGPDVRFYQHQFVQTLVQPRLEQVTAHFSVVLGNLVVQEHLFIRIHILGGILVHEGEELVNVLVGEMLLNEQARPEQLLREREPFAITPQEVQF